MSPESSRPLEESVRARGEEASVVEQNSLLIFVSFSVSLPRSHAPLLSDSFLKLFIFYRNRFLPLSDIVYIDTGETRE